MTITNWTNGLGGSTGDVLGTCKPLMTSGSVRFVSSATGADENDGGDESRPKATLASALSGIGTHGIIVLLEDHNETITSTVDVDTMGVTIVGRGNSGGIPSARLTRNYDGAMLTLALQGLSIQNVRFPASLAASASSRIAVTGANCRISDCYFECGANEQGAALGHGAGSDSFTLIDTTFISTAAATGDQPVEAILISAALADYYASGVVFDAGASGWGNYYAADMSAFAITRMHWESISLLRGSDIRIHASTTGRLNVQTSTGSGKVFW